MTLVQHLKIPEYRKMYEERMKHYRDKVILDNGAYEKVTSDDILMHWVKEFKPTIVVLPDAPNNPLLSTCKSNKFLFELKKQQIDVKTMWVVHTDGKLETSEGGYSVATGSYANYVAFSRLTPSFGKGCSTRLQFIKHLQKKKLWSSSHFHHALGMLNGDVTELHSLSLSGINSIDSSAPIWRGLHGLSLWEDWTDIPFDPTYEGGNWTQAEINLKEVLQACK